MDGLATIFLPKNGSKVLDDHFLGIVEWAGQGNNWHKKLGADLKWPKGREGTPTDSPLYSPLSQNRSKQPWLTKNYQNRDKYGRDKELNGRHRTNGDQNFQSRGGEI